MRQIGWLLLVLPLLAVLTGFALPSAARRVAALVAVGALAVSTALSVALAFAVVGDHGKAVVSAATIARFGELQVRAGVRLDGLAVVVAVAVCVVALLVQIYSVAYLNDDERYVRYAAEVSLFTAAMLIVVLASDLIMLVVGWETMGICSYLLIGHYRHLPEARPAAVKAFVVTRVGDIGFLLGVLVLGVGAGSFDIGRILAEAGALPRGTVAIACLLLLAGVAGKSAQFPLHTWLPDAMVGPTPISALIHAATMVAAGIFVVARLFPLFLVDPLALNVLGVIAAITMLLGALAALAQDDLKRVLAWSTVSQIAYMSGGLAVGVPAAAVFHLLTHAAFKALLFLAAGCVLYATGQALMSKMGGLRTAMPVTFVTMTLGLAALIGIPPLSGFFSKEALLGAAYERVHGSGGGSAWVALVVLLAGLATVALTGAYATRLWLLTFFGPRPEPRTLRQPSPLMTGSLVVLAVPTVLLGIVGLRREWLGTWLDVGHTALGPTLATTALSLLLSFNGIGVVVLVWRRFPGADPVPAPAVLARAFYLDEIQSFLVVRPYRRLAQEIRDYDARVVDGAVEGNGRVAMALSSRLSRLQTGNVQTYAGAVLGAAVVLAVIAVLL
ncbi:MAG: NADH-quinone oxidoreductase subunit L [Mycobacteriales bacterium]